MSDYTLENISILLDLSEEDRAAIAERCDFREYKPGDVIFEKGDRSSDIYFVVRGTVRVISAEGEDHDVPLAEIDEGDVFGEFAAFDGRARSGQAIAIKETLLALLSAEEFLFVSRSHHEISFAIIRMLISRIRTANERFTELAVLPDKVRICREILRLSRPNEDDPREFILQPAPSHRELASWTGTTQQVVNETIGWLLKSSILSRPRGEMRKFIVRDFIRLKSLCEFNRFM
ncbi:MAG: Crp/Fnr family transcriptional regulator [Magnetospiraceae bacterium]